MRIYTVGITGVMEDNYRDCIREFFEIIAVCESIERAENHIEQYLDSEAVRAKVETRDESVYSYQFEIHEWDTKKGKLREHWYERDGSYSQTWHVITDEFKEER